METTKKERQAMQTLPSKAPVTFDNHHTTSKESVNNCSQKFERLVRASAVGDGPKGRGNAGTSQEKTTPAIKLFGIKNESATLVTPCEPWSFVPEVPDSKGDKKAYGKWLTDPDTEHLLFNGSEGTNPDLRPKKKTNPVVRLHCLIADYDSNIADAMAASVESNAPADLRPNWISTTFSGGRRLVWLFEKPIPLDNEHLRKEFLKLVGDELHASKLLPGLDRPAWERAEQFYDVGTDWKQISETPIRANVLHYWLFEASKRTDWSKVGELHIPLADIEEQLHKQFPGVWSGEFIVGARGPVFWEGRSNPSAAVVTEAGMIAFSSHKLFHTWGEIFGAAFIRKYQADKIGGAVKDVWFDGATYYRKINDKWKTETGTNFVKWLGVRRGLDNTKGRGEITSETTQAEIHVQENRRVDGVAPRLFDPRDVIEENGQRILNNSCEGDSTPR